MAVTPGTYTVTEDDPAADGYELSDISLLRRGPGPAEDSSDEGRTATIRVQAGENVTCTYTNTKQGSVTIKKETDPEEDPNATDFTFSSDLPGAGNDSFTLQDDGTRGPVAVTPGTYTVTEDDPAADGYELSDIACSDEGQAPGGLLRRGPHRHDPGPGRRERHLHLHQRPSRAQVTIKKETDPEEEPNATDFTFSSDLARRGQRQLHAPGRRHEGPGGGHPGHLHGHRGRPRRNRRLRAVRHQLLTTRASDPEDSSDEGRTATIPVQAGENVTCTYTNDQAGLRSRSRRRPTPRRTRTRPTSTFSSDLPGRRATTASTLQRRRHQGPGGGHPGHLHGHRGRPCRRRLRAVGHHLLGRGPATPRTPPTRAAPRRSGSRPARTSPAPTPTPSRAQVTIKKETDPEEEPNATDFDVQLRPRPARATTASRSRTTAPGARWRSPRAPTQVDRGRPRRRRLRAVGHHLLGRGPGPRGLLRRGPHRYDPGPGRRERHLHLHQHRAGLRSRS